MKEIFPQRAGYMYREGDRTGPADTKAGLVKEFNRAILEVMTLSNLVERVPTAKDACSARLKALQHADRALARVDHLRDALKRYGGAGEANLTERTAESREAMTRAEQAREAIKRHEPAYSAARSRLAASRVKFVNYCLCPRVGACR